MTYDLDPKTELRGGDTYPDEQHRITDPGVYALRCCRPDDPRTAWLKTYDVLPSYIDALEDADGCVYVGAAGGSVLDRIHDHIKGNVRQTAFTSVCPPHSVLATRVSDTPFPDEFNFGVEIGRKHPDWYVHQR